MNMKYTLTINYLNTTAIPFMSFNLTLHTKLFVLISITIDGFTEGTNASC